MNRFAVILAAAGLGTRFDSGRQKKTYAVLAGVPLWQHCLARFAARDDVKQILIVVSPEDCEWFAKTYRDLIKDANAEVVAGGAQRTDSVANGLAKVADGVEFVAIHDAARPCIRDSVIERTFSLARQLGNATPAVPLASTLKKSTDGRQVIETVDRSGLYMSQTPQVFRVAELREAFDAHQIAAPTDEAQLFESLGRQVYLAEGCPLNIKVTTRRDIDFAAAAIALIEKEDRSEASIRFDGPVDNPADRSQLR